MQTDIEFNSATNAGHGGMFFFEKKGLHRVLVHNAGYVLTTGRVTLFGEELPEEFRLNGCADGNGVSYVIWEENPETGAYDLLDICGSLQTVVHVLNDEDGDAVADLLLALSGLHMLPSDALANAAGVMQ